MTIDTKPYDSMTPDEQRAFDAAWTGPHDMNGRALDFGDVVVVEKGRYKGSVGLLDDEDEGDKLIIYTRLAYGPDADGVCLSVSVKNLRLATPEEERAWRDQQTPDGTPVAEDDEWDDGDGTLFVELTLRSGRSIRMTGVPEETVDSIVAAWGSGQRLRFDFDDERFPVCTIAAAAVDVVDFHDASEDDPEALTFAAFAAV